MNSKQQLKEEAKKIIIDCLNNAEDKNLMIFIKSVSRSGMSRKMKVLIESRDITYYVNDLLGHNHPKGSSEYVNVTGCGMDMAFWLADTICYYLWTNKEEMPENLRKGNGGNCLNWVTIS